MSVNLSGAIHARWAAAAPLAALLPAARLITGTSVGAAVPLALLAITRDRPVAACNDGSTVRAIGLRFQVLHSRYDAATAIVAQLEAVLDRTDFALDGGNKVIFMRRTGGAEQQQNDGVWQMTVEFDCLVYAA